MNLIEEYLNNGLKIIPIYPNSKIPIGKDWYKKWNVNKVKNIYNKNPNCNWGILLGEIVDIEGDSPEANDYINYFTKDIKHPRFKSSKSIHHLFRNGNPYIYSLNYKDIEFRGYKRQSLIPPSTHCDGTQYEWIEKHFDFPPIPKPLLNLYYKHAKPVAKKKRKDFRNVHCQICNKKVVIHKKRFDLEIKAFRIIKLNWSCNKCREVDVRDLCRTIRKSN